MKVNVERRKKLFEIQGGTLAINSQSQLEDIVFSTMSDCGILDCFIPLLYEHYEDDAVQRLIRLCDEGEEVAIQDVGIVALYYIDIFESKFDDKITALGKVFCEITANDTELEKYEKCFVYFLNVFILSTLQSLSGYSFCDLLYKMHKELIEQ